MSDRNVLRLLNARFTHSHDALRMPKISIRDGGSRI